MTVVLFNFIYSVFPFRHRALKSEFGHFSCVQLPVWWCPPPSGVVEKGPNPHHRSCSAAAAPALAAAYIETLRRGFTCPCGEVRPVNHRSSSSFSRQNFNEPYPGLPRVRSSQVSLHSALSVWWGCYFIVVFVSQPVSGQIL